MLLLLLLLLLLLRTHSPLGSNETTKSSVGADGS